MRLASTDLIAGMPAPKARELLRVVNSRNGLWVESAARVLSRKLGVGTEVLDQLVAGGYLELKGSGRDRMYDTTITGNAVAIAKFTKPISRAKAQQILDAFLDRVRAVNADPMRLHSIELVTLYGSFLKGADNYGDVDTSIRIVRRLYGDAHKTAHQALIAAAPPWVRQAGIISAIDYPYRQLLTFLRNRNPWLSITDEDVSTFTNDYRTVYRHADDPDALPFSKLRIGESGTPDRK